MCYLALLPTRHHTIPLRTIRSPLSVLYWSAVCTIDQRFLVIWLSIPQFVIELFSSINYKFSVRYFYLYLPFPYSFFYANITQTCWKCILFIYYKLKLQITWRLFTSEFTSKTCTCSLHCAEILISWTSWITIMET